MQSDNINELAAALAVAQGAIKGAEKNSKNDFTKKDYADLASVWDAIREPFSNNGLAVVQTTGVMDGRVNVHTTLLHSSGQWVTGSLPIIMKADDAQSQGSAITYARRYALQAIAGVAPIEDDGEAAVGRAPEKAAPKPPASKPPAPSKSAPASVATSGDAKPPASATASATSSPAPATTGTEAPKPPAIGTPPASSAPAAPAPQSAPAQDSPSDRPTKDQLVQIVTAAAANGWDKAVANKQLVAMLTEAGVDTSAPDKVLATWTWDNFNTAVKFFTENKPAA